MSRLPKSIWCSSLPKLAWTERSCWRNLRSMAKLKNQNSWNYILKKKLYKIAKCCLFLFLLSSTQACPIWKQRFLLKGSCGFFIGEFISWVNISILLLFRMFNTESTLLVSSSYSKTQHENTECSKSKPTKLKDTTNTKKGNCRFDKVIKCRGE